MSFDKDYPKRKDWRKEYPKKAQRCCMSCRPGGSCPWCVSNRKIQEKREMGRLNTQDEDNDI